MNRQQRRMNGQQKRIKNARRQENKIQRDAERVNKIKREGVEFAIDALHPIIFYSLIKVFGFRAPRIGRFTAEFNHIVAEIAQKNVSIDAIAEDVKDMTGIEFLDELGEWYFPKRKDARK